MDARLVISIEIIENCSSRKFSLKVFNYYHILYTEVVYTFLASLACVGGSYLNSGISLTTIKCVGYIKVYQPETNFEIRLVV